MERTISFGKIAAYGSRKINELTVTLDLTKTKKGYAFTASADVWNSKHSDIVIGGQCLDEPAVLDAMKHNKLFMTIFDWWKRFHLNDMHAGTQEQDDILDRYSLEHPNAHLDYDQQCKVLQDHHALVVKLPDGSDYMYGSAWLFRTIPDDVVKDMMKVINQ